MPASHTLTVKAVAHNITMSGKTEVEKVAPVPKHKQYIFHNMSEEKYNKAKVVRTLTIRAHQSRGKEKPSVTAIIDNMRYKEYPRENTSKRASIHLVPELSQALPTQHNKIKTFCKHKKLSQNVSGSKMVDIANNNEDSQQVDIKEASKDIHTVHKKYIQKMMTTRCL